MATQAEIRNLISSRIQFVGPHYTTDYQPTEEYKAFQKIVEKWHASNLPGKSKKAEARRATLEMMLLNHAKPAFGTAAESWKRRLSRKAKGLAEQAGINFDEYGSSRGDYRTTRGIDYVAPSTAKNSPYFDMGGAGLGLVSVTRETVYAKSCTWRPSSTTEHYLVGRNEAGTFFSHRVPTSCTTVLDAISWMWEGRQGDIVLRQGDIALIHGSGPKGLDKMPSGHKVDGTQITHATHPTIRVPGKGERIIVARRAGIRGNGASTETRD
jgi:hypothetical protein